jgi:hypothetical protein
VFKEGLLTKYGSLAEANAAYKLAWLQTPKGVEYAEREKELARRRWQAKKLASSVEPTEHTHGE